MIDEVSVERVRVAPHVESPRDGTRAGGPQVNVPTVGAVGWNCRGLRPAIGCGRLCHEAARSAPVHDSAVADERAIAGGHGLECLSITAGSSRGIAADAGGDCSRSRVRPFADGRAGGFAARGCFAAGRGRKRRRGRVEKLLWSGKFGATDWGAGGKSTIWELSKNKMIASLDLAVANNIPVRWAEMVSVPVIRQKFQPHAKSRRKNV